MENPFKITVFGRDHEARDSIHLQCVESADVALGTCVGTLSKPNEDAIGVSVLGSERVLAIADGHWGYDASEIAISKAVEMLDARMPSSKYSETRARQFALFEQINVTLFDRAMASPGSPAPETSLIVCQIKESTEGKFLYWASFGDSFLYLLRNGNLRQINPLGPYWLGFLSRFSEHAKSKTISIEYLSDRADYVGVASGLESGIERLEAGDILFLCTDGLTGSDREPEAAVTNEIQAILASSLLPEAKIEKIIRSALARGEEDNISCVMAQIS
jgi:serine/threonine protein phosphatase PrpC